MDNTNLLIQMAAQVNPFVLPADTISKFLVLGVIHAEDGISLEDAKKDLPGIDAFTEEFSNFCKASGKTASADAILDGHEITKAMTKYVEESLSIGYRFYDEINTLQTKHNERRELTK